MCVFYAAAVQRRHLQMWDAALSNLPPLNQANLPAMLDKYRIGGRRLDLEDDSSQSVNF
jgi:hypothetical protein